METNEISLHLAKVYNYSKTCDRWFTNKEVAESTGVSPRTARQHTLTLHKLGILDQMEVFPGHRFRLSEMASKRNSSYLQRLEQACAVFSGEL